MKLNVVGRQTLYMSFGLLHDVELTVEEEKRFYHDLTNAVQGALDGTL